MTGKSFNPKKLGPRIKIKDLPADRRISNEEMKAVLGGVSFAPSKLMPPLVMGRRQQGDPPDYSVKPAPLAVGTFGTVNATFFLV